MHLLDLAILSADEEIIGKALAVATTFKRRAYEPSVPLAERIRQANFWISPLEGPFSKVVVDPKATLQVHLKNCVGRTGNDGATLITRIAQAEYDKGIKICYKTNGYRQEVAEAAKTLTKLKQLSLGMAVERDKPFGHEMQQRPGPLQDLIPDIETTATARHR